MPDLADLLRESVARAAATYEPSDALPRRIARRTLQLQRRRRGRIVGGVAVLAAAVFAVPVVLPLRGRSNTVGVGYEPVNITARNVKVTTTTTTTPPDPARLLDLEAFIANGLEERNRALARLATALRKRDRDEASKRRAAAEVRGALATRGAAPGRNPASGGGASGGPSAGPGGGPTSTTKKPSSTTTDPPTTTTTDPPPPPPQPPTPIEPLSIVAPAYVCAGVPAVFVAVGSGADLVVWSNEQIGSLGIFTLAESATITARLEFPPGSSTSKQRFVQVTPAGSPPC